jgi:segregation and condensation protein A
MTGRRRGGAARERQDVVPHMAIDLRQESSTGFQVRLQQFEGPLDLLLHLIREQELDIYDIPIARVTDQYLLYLQRMEQLDLDVAGEFLVMAATLIELKSRLLLPRPPAPAAEEGPDPRAELVQRLLEYEKYREVASLLRDQEETCRLLYSRTVEVDPEELPPVPSAAVTTADLLAALKRVLERASTEKAPAAVIPRRRITLRLKMGEILRRLRESGGRLLFHDLFSPERTRTEVVMAFLALLELLRQRRVDAAQERCLGEIVIFQTAGEAAEVAAL